MIWRILLNQEKLDRECINSYTYWYVEFCYHCRVSLLCIDTKGGAHAPVSEWGGVSSVQLLLHSACKPVHVPLLWYVRFCSISEARVATCNVSLCLPVQVYDVNKLYGDIK